MTGLPNSQNLIESGFEELRIEPTHGQIESLVVLSQLLFRWSKRINLTGHRTEQDIVKRLVLDAVALAVHIPDVPSLADIGSGAGFPGFPIAILRPGTEVFLVESRERRHHFQREAARVLALENATAMLGRAEEFDEPTCAAAIAQAVAPREAISLLLHWVRPGGLLLFPGSESSEDLPTDAEVVVQDVVEYRVPCGGPLRKLRIASKRIDGRAAEE